MKLRFSAVSSEVDCPVNLIQNICVGRLHDICHWQNIKALLSAGFGCFLDMEHRVVVMMLTSIQWRRAFRVFFLIADV